ncbi:MAG: SDR family NAD(P)-dependent oxidoreductase [Paludibacter sp.]
MINQLVFSAGIILFAVLLYKLVFFLYPYIRPSRIKNYLSPDAFAVISGSTDGIGKALALELAAKGFNVVLHGRNPEKLQAVEMEIKTKYPERKTISLLHDGSKNSRLDISIIKDLPITVLVNNVGVGPINELGRFTENEIDETILLNTAFPAQLTRSLLPFMKKKSLILNVSSYAGIIPPPYLAVYAGTKAFNNAFSKSLSRELPDKEVISLITGSVHSNANNKPVTMMRPASETYARAVLGIVGCGRKSIMPYFPQALQTIFMTILPEWLIDVVIKSAMLKEME